MTNAVASKSAYPTTILDSGPLPDEFTDSRAKRWIWKNLVTKKAESTSALARDLKYRIDLGSIQRWNEDGCIALEGKKLDLQRRRVKGEKGPGRLYVRKSDLDRIQQFKHSEHPEAGKPWLLYKDAVKIVPHAVLFRFGSNRKSSPEIHPALGRSIKFDFRHVSTKGRVVEQILYWQPDLQKIVEYQPPREIWVTAAVALTEYTPVTDNDIRRAERAGRLHATVFALPPEQFRGTFIKHFLRSEMTVLRSQKEQRNKLRPESPNRVYVDPDGARWLPLAQVARTIPLLEGPGKNYRLKEWSVGCQYLDGKPLPMKRVSMEIFRSKFGGTVRVWLESQILQIARRLRGEIDPVKPNVDNHDIHAKLDGLHAKHDEHHRATVVSGKRIKSIHKDTKAMRAKIEVTAEKQLPLFLDKAASYPASHFNGVYGIPVSRLDSARRDGRLKKCEFINGRWHFDEGELRNLWGVDFIQQ